MSDEELTVLDTKATDSNIRSSLDWGKHRERIIHLYAHQKHTIGEVRALMIRNYNFKATVRQYTRRLKYWDVLKNLKAKEKDEILARVAEARAQNRKVIDVKFRGHSVDIARLRRHSSSKLKQSSRPNRPSRRMRLESPDIEGPQYQIEIICEDDGLESEEVVKYEEHSTQEGSCANNQMTTTENLPSSYLVSRNRIRENTLKPRTQNSTLPLPRQFNNSGPIATMESILHLTKTFILGNIVSSLGAYPLVGSYSSSISANTSRKHSLEMMNFWTDVKNSIYFMKLGPKEALSGRTLASEACQKLMCSSGLSVDITILKELFCTLSHANTGICPKIRTFLLKNLISVFTLRLGQNHPLPRLCSYLHNATLESDASQRALHFSLGNLESYLGQDHTIVYDTRRALIRQLRRSRNLHSAKELCKLQIASTKRLHDPTSSVVRKTRSELVHIYKAEGNLLLAKELCQVIVNSGSGFPFPDETAIYAMEDLAELRDLMGDREGCLEILGAARDGASCLWGWEASPTVCIARKIQLLSVN